MPDPSIVRAGRADDHEAIVALEVAAFGASDEPIVRSRLDAAADGWLIVEDPDGPADRRLLSASVLLHHDLRLGDVTIPIGQIENVVTRPSHQRRGLVRAQFDEHHRRSADAGDLAIVITGIPYLYRRFGYGYGLDYPAIRLPSPATSEAWPLPTGVVVRAATAADLAAIGDLDATRPTDQLRIVRTAESWAQVLARTGTRFEQLAVAERDGCPVGFAGLEARPADGRLYLQPGMALDVDAARALIRYAVDQAAAHGEHVVAWDNPGTLYGDVLASVGAEVRHTHGIYVRVPDALALLDRVRPLLSARLAASRFADRTGELMISLYESGLALAYDQGQVVGVRATDPIEDPFDSDDVGIPPDQVGALVLGRFGARQLEHRVDDVTLGRHRSLMEVLFPHVDAEVVADL